MSMGSVERRWQDDDGPQLIFPLEDRFHPLGPEPLRQGRILDVEGAIGSESFDAGMLLQLGLERKPGEPRAGSGINRTQPPFAIKEEQAAGRNLGQVPKAPVK